MVNVALLWSYVELMDMIDAGPMWICPYLFFYSLNTCCPWYSILCFRLSLPGPHRRSCDTFSDNVAKHWPRTIEEERGWTEIFSKGNSETHETFSLLSNYLILISAKGRLGVDSFVLEQDTSLLLCLSLPSSLTL